MQRTSLDTTWRRAFADLPHVSPRAIHSMQRHWQLLQSWNQRTNLTAIVDEEEAIWLHYRDSLAVWPWIDGPHIVDFGSGAGFPGLVLAMVNPDLEITLVEPRRRRTSFLTHAVAELGAKSVRILKAKVESLPAGPFDHAVTRATFSSPDFVPQALAWLRPGGTLLCHRSVDTAPWGTRHPYALAGPATAHRQRCIDQITHQPPP